MPTGARHQSGSDHGFLGHQSDHVFLVFLTTPSSKIRNDTTRREHKARSPREPKPHRAVNVLGNASASSSGNDERGDKGELPTRLIMTTVMEEDLRSEIEKSVILLGVGPSPVSVLSGTRGKRVICGFLVGEGRGWGPLLGDVWILDIRDGMGGSRSTCR